MEGFKNTDVGIIPNDWNTPFIKEFTDILSGGTPSTKMPEYWGGIIRWMNSGELNLKRVYEVEGRITESGLKNSATKLIPPKCVLVGLAGQGKTRGTVAINYVSLCTNQSIAAILPTKEFDEDYLYHNLDLRYKELRSLSTGDGGRGGLNLTLLRNLQIPTPPTKAEQTAIATALNDADALIQKLEQLIAKKRLIKQGAMQKCLNPDFYDLGDDHDLTEDDTQKSQNQTNQRNHRSDKWEVKKLGEVADIIRGGSPRPIEAYLTKDVDGINWIKIGDVDKAAKYIFSTEEKIIPKGVAYSRTVKEGDFLLSNSMSFGRPYILKTSGCVHDGWLVIQNYHDTFDTNFLYYLLGFETTLNQYRNLAAGSTVLNLNKEIVTKVSVCYPNLEEQTRIAQILSDMDNEIEALEKQLDKYKMLKQGMMQVLLTGKIRLNCDFLIK